MHVGQAERQPLGLGERGACGRAETEARQAAVEVAHERARHGRPDRRGPEQAGDARDRVVDARGDPRLGNGSAPASTAAVSGATVIARPSANTSSAGSTSVR